MADWIEPMCVCVCVASDVQSVRLPRHYSKTCGRRCVLVCTPTRPSAVLRSSSLEPDVWWRVHACVCCPVLTVCVVCGGCVWLC